MRNIEEIRAELKAAEQAAEAEARALRESVKPEYEFTLRPNDRYYDRLYDETCAVYQLEGRLVNEEALREVGAMHIPGNGGMAYLFNKGTGRIVTSLGGGTIYVAKAFGAKDDDSDVTAMAELSAFLVEHPEGGDVTGIVRAHRERRGH